MNKYILVALVGAGLLVSTSLSAQDPPASKSEKKAQKMAKKAEKLMNKTGYDNPDKAYKKARQMNEKDAKAVKKAAKGK